MQLQHSQSSFDDGSAIHSSFILINHTVSEELEEIRNKPET